MVVTNAGMFFLSSAYMKFRPLSASKGACRLPLGAPQHFGNQSTDDERINFLRSSSRGHVRLQDSIVSRGYTTRCVFITTLCVIRRTCTCICICTCIILYHDVYVTEYVLFNYILCGTTLCSSTAHCTYIQCTVLKLSVLYSRTVLKYSTVLNGYKILFMDN